MYAASVSWIVLSYSFRAMTRRASASLIFDNRSVRMLRGGRASGGASSGAPAAGARPPGGAAGVPRARGGGRRIGSVGAAHLRSFWIFAFSSSSFRIAVFTCGAAARRTAARGAAAAPARRPPTGGAKTTDARGGASDAGGARLRASRADPRCT